MKVLVGSFVIFFGTLLTAGLIELGHPQRAPAPHTVPVHMVAAAPGLEASMAPPVSSRGTQTAAPQGAPTGVGKAR